MVSEGNHVLDTVVRPEVRNNLVSPPTPSPLHSALARRWVTRARGLRSWHGR